MHRTPDAIISIHPTYADAILSGQKTIELRRRLPELARGTTLWIYATRPTGAVIGVATIENVSRGRPLAIWRKHGRHAGIGYDTFKDYFAGAPEAVAISLGFATRVDPITIEQLRDVRDHFHPPQVLVRLSELEAAALRKLAKVPA